jgi:hypothetical protein
MTEAVERRAIAFIRTIGNRCTSCLRRNEENCRRCVSRWANSILRDIENDTKPEIDCSLQARMMMIVDCLNKADRPLLSSEIDMKQYCTKQLKRWTLMRLVKAGKVKRVKRNKNYRYSLV